jgi:hypothetical protein
MPSPLKPAKRIDFISVKHNQISAKKVIPNKDDD